MTSKSDRKSEAEIDQIRRFVEVKEPRSVGFISPEIEAFHPEALRLARDIRAARSRSVK